MSFKGELIGSTVEVIESSNKNLVGLKGKIIDETKNMLVLNNKKMIDKRNVMLKVNNGNTLFLLDGKKLIGKSEDRLKKVIKNE